MLGHFISDIVLEKHILSLCIHYQSLFRLRCVEGMSPRAWLKKFDKLMPSFYSVEALLKQHLYINICGRLLYKSMKRACNSAMNIAFFHFVREPKMNGENNFCLYSNLHACCT